MAEQCESKANLEGSAFIVSIPFGLAHLPAESVKTNEGNEWAQTATATNARAFVEEALRWAPIEAESQIDGETQSVDAMDAALPSSPPPFVPSLRLVSCWPTTTRICASM